MLAVSLDLGEILSYSLFFIPASSLDASNSPTSSPTLVIVHLFDYRTPSG
jgi:hypothetical protein